jgi:hypothetical protein
VVLDEFGKLMNLENEKKEDFPKVPDGTLADCRERGRGVV